mmetsp:Transcript_23090/g.49988  ORF Transcript_23090/g.49988 Transcript_23090/m.49988 type:complete len:526 (-) Transcript_23090:1108-2685(-)
MTCLKIVFFLALLKSTSPLNTISNRNNLKYFPTITTKMARASDTAQMESKLCEETNTLSPYDALLCRLYTTNLFNVKNDGLKNMERLHHALGSPMDQDNISIVHVAGSNGKGSTALKMAHTLHLANYRVGLFSSPHISSFRERIQINQVPVSEEQIQRHLQEIFDICDSQSIPATFFEVITALAFVIFVQEKVDIVVLETGLGGRLDATNVVKHPAISVITSIGLEHTKILGDTIEKIALEKGGIIKEGCPVLVGKNVPVEVLRNCAAEKKASQFYECDDLLGKESMGTDPLAWKVDYDSENSRVATAALTLLQKIWDSEKVARKNHSKNISTQLINEGVKVRPSCRFEEIDINTSITNNAPVKVILDVAHNPQAIEYLIAKLHTSYPSSQLRIVVGFSADKDIKSCSDILLENVSHPNRIHLVESPNPRAASINSILEANPKLNECNYKDCSREISSVSLQVQEALNLAGINNELLVICGSFFIMADARKELGIEEPRDSGAIGEETAKIIERRKHAAAKNQDI